MTRSPAHEPDAVDLIDPGPLPGRYIRTINGPIDLDHPPMTTGTAADRIDLRRPGRKPAPQSNRPISPRLKSARPRLVWVVGGLIFAISFVAALRLTEPARAPTPAMMTLAGATIPDLRRLMAAVKTAGLRGTPDVKGAIDEITRLDIDHVTLKGWAADISGNGTPLAVMVFVDGRNTLTMDATGGRPEIANELGLSGAASANISFQANLVCSRGQRLIVVAVAPRDVYGHFGARLCP
jgi:hypothetical protein